MGLFQKKNVMDWYRKHKNLTLFATDESRRKAANVFETCCRHSSQEQLMEYVLIDWFCFIPIAVKYMDDEHLIQYACRKPIIKPSGYITDEENRKENGEVLAIQSIRSSEAIAELYRLYQSPGVNCFHRPSYYNKYGEKRREALENRIDEKEAVIIIRRMMDDNEKISPDSWLAQKITNDELKRELGLDVTKEWAIDNYKNGPELRRAQLLRSKLDDDEILQVLRESRYDYRAEKYLLTTIQNENLLAEYLLMRNASDVTGTLYHLVFDILPHIHTQGLLDPLLHANPLHGYAAIYVIKNTDKVETLLAFREKLIALRGHIYEDEHSTHFLNKRPDPSDDNLIILSSCFSSLKDIWGELNYKINHYYLYKNLRCTQSAQEHAQPVCGDNNMF